MTSFHSLLLFPFLAVIEDRRFVPEVRYNRGKPMPPQTLAATGGGLMLSLSLPTGRKEAASSGGIAPNAFLRIDNEGNISMRQRTRCVPIREQRSGTSPSIRH